MESLMEGLKLGSEHGSGEESACGMESLMEGLKLGSEHGSGSGFWPGWEDPKVAAVEKEAEEFIKQLELSGCPKIPGGRNPLCLLLPGDTIQEKVELWDRNMEAQLRDLEKLDADQPTSKNNEELLAKYWQQIEESEGFDIVNLPDGYQGLPIAPWTPMLEDPEEAADFGELATLALQKFNRNNAEGDTYKLHKVITLNSGPEFLYYLTFLAMKEGAHPDDPLVTFQARVQDAITRHEGGVQLCRIKKSPS